MKQNEKAQKLREYLRNYTSCQSRKESLTKCLERETDDAVRKILFADKEKISAHCENVLLIMDYLAPDSLARQIFDKHYLQGMSMERTSFALSYSYGYCANVESAAIKQLVQKEEVMLLINFASERAGSIPF